MDNNRTPKFKIGERVYAHWEGGHTTEHIVTGVREEKWGFWYTWEDILNYEKQMI